MFLVYLGEVAKRAFTPTSRLTDGLQVAAASALPAATRLAGLDIAPSVEVDALAYIGLVALSFIVIRFFWAPYDMWKDQAGRIAELNLELSKPERLIVEHLAKKKAENRLLIIEHLRQLYDSGYDYRRSKNFSGYTFFNDACHLLLISGLDEDLRASIIALLKASEFRFHNKLGGEWSTDIRCLNDIATYIDGRITIEDLLRRWPQDIEFEKPQ